MRNETENIINKPRGMMGGGGVMMNPRYPYFITDTEWTSNRIELNVLTHEKARPTN